MTREQQDLTWQCLPKDARLGILQLYVEFKAESKNNYIYRPFWVGIIRKIEDIFGHHNLTSDTEPPELLFVERKKVIEYYKDVQQAIGEENGDTKIEMEGRRCAVLYLFGNKCLPGKELNEDNFAKPEPSVQGGPKLKAGSKAKVVENNSTHVGEIVTLVRKMNDNWLVIDNSNDRVYFRESSLEPYTEPETKDNSNMEEKELNLCEILRDYKGEKIYILSHGYMTVMGGIIGTVELEGTGEHGEVLNLMLNDDGTHIKGTEVIAFPSRALYEKYPLDAYSAWMEWKSDRTPKRWTPQIGERIFWVNANLTVSQDRFNDYETQRKRRAAGNEFKTGQEAKQAAEAVRECLMKFH